MKFSELKSACDNINEFCTKTKSVITYSNNNGDYVGRMTTKNVQIFVVSGKSLVDCIVNANIKVSEKRKKLGV